MNLAPPAALLVALYLHLIVRLEVEVAVAIAENQQLKGEVS